MKTSKFYTPNCTSCPAMVKIGPPGYETPYCNGFGGKKKRRLPKAGLHRAVTPWCPKTLSPPVCRILGFVDETNEKLEMLLQGDALLRSREFVSVTERRYKVRCSYPLNMSAKAFCEAQETLSVQELFPDITFTFGEIVEIDDGHKPYFFYYIGGSKFLPIFYFDKSRMAK